MKVKLKEKVYDIEDPSQFFIDLFTFRSENSSYFPTDHWELVLMALIGSMQSGKTTMLAFFATLGKKLYGDEFSVFHTDNVVGLLKYLNKNPELRKKVLFIFLDDALVKPGQDSRRSMSAENVRASQELSVIRHLLANEDKFGNPDPRYKNGFCVIIYCVQDPNRLDVFFRKNLHLNIYKSYYEQMEKELDQTNLDFIKGVTEESMYKHNYTARGYGLGKTATGGCFRMFYPLCKFDIPIVYTDNSCEEFDKIIVHLLKFDLDEIKDSIAKEIVKEYCTEHEIKIDPKEINEVIDLARYQQWKMKNSEGAQKEDRAQDNEDSDDCNEDIPIQKAVFAWFNDVYAKTRDFRIDNKDLYQAFPLEKPGTLRSIKNRWIKKKQKNANKATVRRKAPTIKEVE